MDVSSINQSGGICKERPYIAWQRSMLHFSVHTRICRIHRPFVLEGSTIPKFAFSRMMCERSAQTVLELKRTMNEQADSSGLRAVRFFISEQHVFMAIVTLATDLCFNRIEPNMEVRKSQILTACKLLEHGQPINLRSLKGIAFAQGVQLIKKMMDNAKGESSSARANAAIGVDSIRYQNTSEEVTVNNLWTVPQPIRGVAQWPMSNDGGGIPASQEIWLSQARCPMSRQTIVERTGVGCGLIFSKSRLTSMPPNGILCRPI